MADLQDKMNPPKGGPAEFNFRTNSTVDRNADSLAQTLEGARSKAKEQGEFRPHDLKSPGGGPDVAAPPSGPATGSDPASGLPDRETLDSAEWQTVKPKRRQPGQGEEISQEDFERLVDEPEEERAVEEVPETKEGLKALSGELLDDSPTPTQAQGGKSSGSTAAPSGPSSQLPQPAPRLPDPAALDKIEWETKGPSKRAPLPGQEISQEEFGRLVEEQEQRAEDQSELPSFPGGLDTLAGELGAEEAASAGIGPGAAAEAAPSRGKEKGGRFGRPQGPSPAKDAVGASGSAGEREGPESSTKTGTGGGPGAESKAAADTGRPPAPKGSKGEIQAQGEGEEGESESKNLWQRFKSALGSLKDQLGDSLQSLPPSSIVATTVLGLMVLGGGASWVLSDRSKDKDKLKARRAREERRVPAIAGSGVVVRDEPLERYVGEEGVAKTHRTVTPGLGGL